MTQSTLAGPRPGRITPIIALLLLGGVIIDIHFASLSPLVGVIAKESGLTGSEIGWILNATMVGSAISVSLTARIGDIYGHRKVLIALIVLALIGAALGATANDFWPLVGGRFLLGIAISVPLSWGLLRPRATAQQIRLVSLAFAMLAAMFAPLAVILGGIMVGLGLPWQSVYWVSFALYAVMLILALLSPETPASARADVRLDWFGGLGLGVWITALLVGISQGPGLGWTSPIVLGSFVLTGVVLAAWIVQQRRTQEPLVSFRNMDVRQALIGFSGLFAVTIVGNGIFFVLPALLQTPSSSGFGHGLSALDSTYVLLAMIPGAALAYLWTRWGLKRLGPKIVLVVSGIGAITVYLGLALVHGPVWMSSVWVFGYALTILSCSSVGYALVASAGRQDNMAVTVSMQNIVQFVGSAVTVAIILNVLVPGADGIIPEATFAGIFIAFAVIIAVLVIVWAVLAPARVIDRHAIDTETDPTVLQPAGR